MGRHQPQNQLDLSPLRPPRRAMATRARVNGLRACWAPTARLRSSGARTRSPASRQSRRSRKRSTASVGGASGPNARTDRRPRIVAARKQTIPKPLPKRSKGACGDAQGGTGTGCRLRGSLKRHGVFESRFFSLRSRFIFLCTFVAAQRACFFTENDPCRFVGRPADPTRLLKKRTPRKNIARRDGGFRAPLSPPLTR